MRSGDEQIGELFSCVHLEKRVRSERPTARDCASPSPSDAGDAQGRRPISKLNFPRAIEPAATCQSSMPSESLPFCFSGCKCRYCSPIIYTGSGRACGIERATLPVRQLIPSARKGWCDCLRRALSNRQPAADCAPLVILRQSA